MRKLIFLFLFLIISVYSCLPAGKVPFAIHECYAQDKIVAVVNNDIITQKDLADFINFMRIQLSQQYKGEELALKLEDAKKGLLDKLIEDRLILQEAKKENIRSDENRVKARMNEIRRHYGFTVEFQRDLAKQGLVPADIENKIREQMLMFNVVEAKVKNKIIVRPDEVTQFYNSKGNEIKTPEIYQVTFVSLENEDLAQGFSYNWKAGQKLADLLIRYPATVNRLEAARGERLRQDIEEQIFKLGIDEISAPINIDGQFYIFKLDNIVAPRRPALFEVQDKIKEIIFQGKMQQELNKWLDELKNKSYIKILQN
jgi:parvulin-like peptidyl-prolyl isomerase